MPFSIIDENYRFFMQKQCCVHYFAIICNSIIFYAYFYMFLHNIYMNIVFSFSFLPLIPSQATFGCRTLLICCIVYLSEYLFFLVELGLSAVVGSLGVSPPLPSPSISFSFLRHHSTRASAQRIAHKHNVVRIFGYIS